MAAGVGSDSFVLSVRCVFAREMGRFCVLIAPLAVDFEGDAAAGCAGACAGVWAGEGCAGKGGVELASGGAKGNAFVEVDDDPVGEGGELKSVGGVGVVKNCDAVAGVGNENANPEEGGVAGSLEEGLEGSDAGGVDEGVVLGGVGGFKFGVGGLSRSNSAGEGVFGSSNILKKNPGS